MDEPQKPNDQPNGDQKPETIDEVEQVAEVVPEAKVEEAASAQPVTAAPKPAPVKTTDAFKVGDLVKVTTRDPKENKVHATPFEGIVISFRGAGDNKTFTVRRVGAMKVAIERIFPFKSPAIESIKVLKSNPVSQAKLYYLRKKTTKK